MSDLTMAMRDMLLAHIDGDASIPVDVIRADSPRLRTMRSLIARGLIRTEKKTPQEAAIAGNSLAMSPGAAFMLS